MDTQTAPSAERIQTLLARSAGYEGFSVLLRSPDERTRAWLDSKEHTLWLQAMESVAADASALGPIARDLARALDETPAAEWKSEHERILGHAVQSPAAAYELEYGLEHSHRQPQELGDIAAFYQAFGLVISTESHERIDHVATECEFLHYLLYKQAAALDDEKQEQAAICESAAHQFLSDHLGQWGTAFAARLSRCASLALMRLSAQLFSEWLRLECMRMQVPEGDSNLSLRALQEKDDVGCASCEVGRGTTSQA
jgi:TorA maturation chaperone TorD